MNARTPEAKWFDDLRWILRDLNPDYYAAHFKPETGQHMRSQSIGDLLASLPKISALAAVGAK